MRRRMTHDLSYRQLLTGALSNRLLLTPALPNCLLLTHDLSNYLLLTHDLWPLDFRRSIPQIAYSWTELPSKSSRRDRLAARE